MVDVDIVERDIEMYERFVEQQVSNYVPSGLIDGRLLHELRTDGIQRHA